MFKVLKIDLNNASGTYDIPENHYVEGTLYTSVDCVILMLRQMEQPRAYAPPPRYDYTEQSSPSTSVNESRSVTTSTFSGIGSLVGL